MKRFVISLLILLLFILLPLVVEAVNDSTQIYLNGKKLHGETEPIRLDDHTYIDVQTASAQLGVEVQWNASQSQLSLQRGNGKVVLFKDRETALVNDREVAIAVQSILMKEEQVYIPIEFVGEQLDMKVYWDHLTRSLMLYQRDPSFMTPKDHFDAVSPVDESLFPIQQPESTIELDHGLTKLLSISSTEHEQIILQLDAQAKPETLALSAPHRFVIDLPSSQLSPELMGEETVQSGVVAVVHPVIEKIRYAMLDATTVRIVLDLKQAAQFHAQFDEKTKQVIVQHVERMYHIVIDPGHGGHDPGAPAASEGEKKDCKKCEKHFNLNVSLKVRDLIDKEPNLRAHMTRTNDSFINLDDRVQFANDVNADLFISIHGNTFTSKISGTESFYWKNIDFAFAQVMHEHAVIGTQLPDRNLRKMEYRVLRNTTMPAVLLELGYLSNAEEEQKLLSEELQNRVAASIVAGIKSYLQLP